MIDGDGLRGESNHLGVGRRRRKGGKGIEIHALGNGTGKGQLSHGRSGQCTTESVHSETGIECETVNRRH